jgi:two-component system phosphate regulon sensor histidine kinase PhoR
MAAFLVVSITFCQFLFLKKAFEFQEKTSDHNIQKALSRVLREINTNGQNWDQQGNKSVNQLSPKYFVVNIDHKISSDQLKSLLKKEFSNMDINGEFQFAVYDKKEKKLLFGDYISHGKPDKKAKPVAGLPVYDYNDYYFCVYFPFKNQNILADMGMWIILSGLLFIAVLFFIYTIYILLKQKRLSEIQKDFINNMTHEFQTPISTISISSEALKDSKMIDSKERIINYATIIQEEALRLQKQVDTILQVARVDQHSIKLNKEKIDAHYHIRKAVEKIQMQTGINPNYCVLNFQAESPYLLADPIHFFNIIYNILENAIKYSKDLPEVIITTSTLKNNFNISISDKGVGMNPKEARLIFKKFYRVPSKKIKNIKGFGIGLYYVRLMTKAHGGKIYVETKVDIGSTFTVCLPN